MYYTQGADKESLSHGTIVERALATVRIDEKFGDSYDGEIAGFVVSEVAESGLVLRSASYDSNQVAVATMTRREVDAELLRLREFVDLVSRLTKSGERLTDSGEIVEDESADLSGDDTHDALMGLIERARLIVATRKAAVTRVSARNDG